MAKVHRHFLSKRDVKALIERASRLHPCLADRLRSLGWEGWEVVKVGEFTVYTHRGSPMLVEVEGSLIPSIKLAEEAGYPRLVVDMGAVPHIVRGADVMAPGVREAPDVMEPGVVLAVADERYGRVLAVGVALMSRREVLEVRRGKALKVLHRVGDEAWRLGLGSRPA